MTKIGNSKKKSNYFGKQKIKKFSSIKKSKQGLDFYLICKENIEKYFHNIEKSIPRFHQTFSEFQQEYLQFYENLFKSSISFQKEMLENLKIEQIQFFGVSQNISKSTEMAIKLHSIENETIVSSVESFKDIIKDWNGVILSYSSVYKKIFQS